MKYLLDTNSCVEHLRHGTQSAVSQRLARVPAGEAAVCSVVRAELVYGSLLGQDSQAGMTSVRDFLAGFESLPFDDEAADHYGSIRAHLRRQGMPIGPNDLLIAPIARANQLILVTTNLREFSRVPGLQCEDWLQT